MRELVSWASMAPPFLRKTSVMPRREHEEDETLMNATDVGEI
jgi:hypothetical protein